MAIPLLNQVYDETRRLAIAGSAVAVGDFRLKKLVPALQQAGLKAHVFAKLAQSSAKVVDSSEATAAEAVLELSVLVNAVLYTQGETGIEGKLEEIETTPFAMTSATTGARALKPLLDALTTTGAGRLEIVKEAFERKQFADFRLIRPTLKALDDSFGEIADFVAENVLPLYGKSILPALNESFDQKGKSGDVRRLRLMNKLDPQGTRDKVKLALEEGSKEVKVAAIECLGSEKEDLEYLLAQLKSKAADVKRAAYAGLCRIDDDKARAALQAALHDGEFLLASDSISLSSDPKLHRIVLNEAEASLKQLLENQEKDPLLRGKSVSRFCWQLQCLAERIDPPTNDFLLKMFRTRDKIVEVKAHPGGKDILNKLILLITDAGPAGVGNAFVDSHADESPEYLPFAMQTACRLRTPAEVFDIFGRYLSDSTTVKKGTSKSKKGNDDSVKGKAIREWITSGHHQLSRLGDTGTATNNRFAYSYELQSRLMKNLDTRWLDIAIAKGDFELIVKLAKPGHTGATKALAEEFNSKMDSPKDAGQVHAILETMVEIQHPGATDALVAMLRKLAKDKTHYGYFWISRLVERLPKSAAPVLESLIPELPEAMADSLMVAIHDLKQREERG